MNFIPLGEGLIFSIYRGYLDTLIGLLVLIAFVYRSISSIISNLVAHILPGSMVTYSDLLDCRSSVVCIVLLRYDLSLAYILDIQVATNCT